MPASPEYLIPNDAAKTVAEAAAFRDGKLTALEIIAVVQFELPANVPSADLYPEVGGNSNAGQAGNH